MATRALPLLLLGLQLATALDVTLKNVECDQSLPMYVVDNSMTVECNGESTCSLGDDAILYGKLQFTGVDEEGLVDGYAFVSADLQLVGLEYQLLQYLQVPICGIYMAVDEDREEECPADGVYEFNVPYVLPEEESKATWLATGWQGTTEILVYAEANNADSLMGSCRLNFATAVTAAEGNSIMSKVPVPSAMVTALVILAFAALLIMSCFYRMIQDFVNGKKKSSAQKGLLDDDGSQSSTEKTVKEKMEP